MLVHPRPRLRRLTESGRRNPQRRSDPRPGLGSCRRRLQRKLLYCKLYRNYRKSANLDAAKRQAATKFYADQAMVMLRDAVGKGYKDAAHMKEDTDLDPLRQREDFKKLLAELEVKQKAPQGKSPPPKKQ